MLKKVVVLCKTCEIVIGGVYMCCFPVFVKLRDGVKNTRLCNLFGMRDLCYQM